MVTSALRGRTFVGAAVVDAVVVLAILGLLGGTAGTRLNAGGGVHAIHEGSCGTSGGCAAQRAPDDARVHVGVSC